MSKQLLFSGIVYLFEKILVLLSESLHIKIVSCFNLKFVPRQKSQQKQIQEVFIRLRSASIIKQTSYECAINNRATQEDLEIVHLTSKEQLKL